MAYKFTGRIKRLGRAGTGKKDNFCEFYVDNSIKINNEEIGVAYNNDKNLTIVEPFKGIKPEFFQILSGAIQERFEIEFEKKKNSVNNNMTKEGATAQNAEGATDSADKDVDVITKVTILR